MASVMQTLFDEEAAPLLPTMSGLLTMRRLKIRTIIAGLAFYIAVVVCSPSLGFSQEELIRKVKSKIVPDYPALARKMSLAGTVKLVVVVSPNGSLKDARVIGGHPVLANAAMDAIKKWKFEPASAESTGTVEFRFTPSEQ